MIFSRCVVIFVDISGDKEGNREFVLRGRGAGGLRGHATHAYESDMPTRTSLFSEVFFTLRRLRINAKNVIGVTCDCYCVS